MRRIALYHLETLLWIERLGTFAAAAERLNATQPAISARVREIEQQMGFQIFRRDGRRATLTTRGRAFLADCERLWADIERTLFAASGFAGATGSVRIGTGEIAAATCLPAFLNEIERELPGIGLEVDVDLTARMLEQLLSGTRDLVFLAGPVRSPGIRTASVGEVRLRCLGNPDSIARWRGLEPGAALPPIWSLPRHSPLYAATRDIFEQRGLDHLRLNTCNNVRTLIDVVRGGSGVAVLPEHMVRQDLSDGSLVDLYDLAARSIFFEAAIRINESDPVVLELFRRAQRLSI